MKNSNTGRIGFTLIELLVVVLIISILAAVALPQYQKAVEKSKASQAFAIMRAVSAAVDVYFLANNVLPRSFDELDVDLTGWDGNEKWYENADARDVKANGDWSVQLCAGGVYVGRISGNYKGAGFIYTPKEILGLPVDRLVCAERVEMGIIFKRNQGDYCEKIWHANFIGRKGGIDAYTM